MIADVERARNPFFARAPVAVPKALGNVADPSGGHPAHAARADELVEQRVRDGRHELERSPPLPDHLVARGEGDQRFERQAERDRRAIGDEAADGLRHRHDLRRHPGCAYCPIDSRYERWFRSSSGIESPPNFSRKVRRRLDAGAGAKPPLVSRINRTLSATGTPSKAMTMSGAVHGFGPPGWPCALDLG